MAIPPIDPANTETPHVPVLLSPILERISLFPVFGWMAHLVPADMRVRYWMLARSA